MAVRMEDWKLVVKKGAPHLYDLSKDIHEDTDIAAQHPDIVKKMLEVIRQEHRPNDMFPITLPKFASDLSGKDREELFFTFQKSEQLLILYFLT